MSNALLDQVVAPIGGAPRLEVPRLRVVLGRVHAPASAPYGLGHGGLIKPGLGLHGRRAEGLRRPLTVAAFCLFAYGGMDPDWYDIGDTMCGDDRFGGLPRFSRRSEPLLALRAFMERVALLNRALGALA